MAVCKVVIPALLAAASLALADGGRSPGEEYGGGAGGGTTSAPYASTIQVYGPVRTNYVAVFLDNTGRRVGGIPATNVNITIVQTTTNVTVYQYFYSGTATWANAVIGPQSNELTAATVGVASNAAAISVIGTNVFEQVGSLNTGLSAERSQRIAADAALASAISNYPGQVIAVYTNGGWQLYAWVP